MAPKGYIEVNGTTLWETDDAVLIDCGWDETIWIPKSQLEDWPDIGDNGDVLMTEWIAGKKGVI